MKHDAQRIEQLDIARLIPYARNSRTHSDYQVAQIAGSIREFGFTNPVLIDAEDGIIAGHGRVLAAQTLALASVPCLRLSHLTETQRRAYIIADNKLALNAGWDDAMLAVEFAELAAMGYDTALTGFTADEIASLSQDESEQTGQGGAGSLSEKFMIPPFSVLNAREGWWQNRKRAWLALGIKSEIGRGGERGSKQSMEYAGGFSARHGAAPGGSARPAADYSKRQRGNGAGRAISGS